MEGDELDPLVLHQALVLGHQLVTVLRAGEVDRSSIAQAETNRIPRRLVGLAGAGRSVKDQVGRLDLRGLGHGRVLRLSVLRQDKGILGRGAALWPGSRGRRDRGQLLEHIAFQRLTDIRPVLHKARHVVQVACADGYRGKSGLPGGLDEVVESHETGAFGPAHQMCVLVR